MSEIINYCVGCATLRKRVEELEGEVSRLRSSADINNKRLGFWMNRADSRRKALEEIAGGDYKDPYKAYHDIVIATDAIGGG